MARMTPFYSQNPQLEVDGVGSLRGPDNPNNETLKERWVILRELTFALQDQRLLPWFEQKAWTYWHCFAKSSQSYLELNLVKLRNIHGEERVDNLVAHIRTLIMFGILKLSSSHVPQLQNVCQGQIGPDDYCDDCHSYHTGVCK